MVTFTNFLLPHSLNMISKENASLPNDLIYFEKQIVFDQSILDIIRNSTPKKRTEKVNKEISNIESEIDDLHKELSIEKSITENISKNSKKISFFKESQPIEEKLLRESIRDAIEEIDDDFCGETIADIHESFNFSYEPSPILKQKKANVNMQKPNSITEVSDSANYQRKAILSRLFDPSFVSESINIESTNIDPLFHTSYQNRTPKRKPKEFNQHSTMIIPEKKHGKKSKTPEKAPLVILPCPPHLNKTIRKRTDELIDEIDTVLNRL